MTELTKLLDRDPIELTRWEASRYDTLAGAASRPIVLHGAGGLGRKTLAGLRKLGIEPLAFTDNHPKAQGETVEGVPVLSPEEAAQRHGDEAVFVVSVFLGGDPIAAQLRALGCRTVLPFYPLFWKHPELFLPHYAYDLPHRVLDARSEVLAAGALMADDASAREYLAQVRWRLDPETPSTPALPSQSIYFASDLYRLSDRETFVDCGGYIGDTVRSFLRVVKSQFAKILVLEPDPRNLERLHATLGGFSADVRAKVSVLTCAVGDRDTTLRFSLRNAASAISDSGEIEVPCRRLDDLLAGERPSFLKMDVEGAEMIALAGAAESIRKHAPLLAISAYHCPDHLWAIPRYVQSLVPGYRFHLRRYSPKYLDDLVLYAVPPSHLPG
jgi:FkbM family methyltransferase